MEDITVVEFGRQGRWKHAKGLVMIVQILPISKHWTQGLSAHWTEAF